jgi:cell division protein FtsA
MANSQISPYFVGIDVGTSGVRCGVGSIDEQGAPEIIGHADSSVSGMRRGVVAHVEEVAEAISKAVGDAERLSGRSIRSATVNINGSHVEGLNSRGVVAISAANREISEDDRLRVEEAASVMKMPANRDIIQVFPKASHRVFRTLEFRGPGSPQRTSQGPQGSGLKAALPVVLQGFTRPCTDL